MAVLTPHLTQERIKSLMPKDSYWPEKLRFYCQTSSTDDPSLHFMVNMWSFALSKGGLTGKQRDAAERYYHSRLKEIDELYKSLGK